MKVGRDEIIINTICSVIIVSLAYFGGIIGVWLIVTIIVAIGFPYFMKWLGVWK